MPDNPWDERAAIKEVIAQFQRLAKPLEAISKLKPGNAESLPKLEAALKLLPPGPLFAQALDEIAERAQTLSAEARLHRTSGFGRLESAFINARAAEGKSLRELDNGWRIAGLELQLDREQSRARVLLNREVLLRWAPIQGPDDLATIYANAVTQVERAALPEAQLPDLLWNAYETAYSARRRHGVSSFPRVPALEVYREFHIALIRNELESRKPGKKITTVELPLWAFLYNLDRYRALGAAVPAEKRLSLETGSQREASAGMGIVINGLDARRDYQVMCYILPAKG